jgi:LL-diaminopimelate aminotransferase
MPKITPAARTAHLSEYFFARANQKIAEVAKHKKVINLGIGNPDLLPHPAVIETLHHAVESQTAHSYPPYNGLLELRAELAAWYSRNYGITLDPKTEVFPTAGSKQGIVHFMLATIDQGDRVLIPDPGYSSYEKATLIAGGSVIRYALDAEHHFLPNLEQLTTQDLRNVKVMWINYPNNPTGATITRDELKKILAFTRRHNIILANDNPYSHVTYDGYHAPSLLEVAEPDDLIIEFNSLSKTYNMAGWRVGWAVGHPELIRLLSSMNSNIETGTFIPLQLAAITALKLDQQWIAERNAVYAERRILVMKILEKLGCQVYKPQAALYVWAKLPEHVKKSELFAFELLEKSGVFITPGTAFGSGGEGYLRASLCQPTQQLEEALERVM